MFTLIKYDLKTIKFILVFFILGIPILGMLIRWDYSAISGAQLSYSTARMFSFLIYILILGAVMRIGKYHDKHNGERFLRTLPLTKGQILLSRFVMTFYLAIIGGLAVYVSIPLFDFNEAFIEAARNIVVFSTMISLVLSGIYIVLLDVIGYRGLFPISWFVYFLLVVLPALLRTVAKRLDSLLLTNILNSIPTHDWFFILLLASIFHFLLAFAAKSMLRKIR